MLHDSYELTREEKRKCMLDIDKSPTHNASTIAARKELYMQAIQECISHHSLVASSKWLMR